jgi:hypothetical protein
MAIRYLNTHHFLLAAASVFLALVHDTNAGAAAGASIERGKYQPIDSPDALAHFVC